MRGEIITPRERERESERKNEEVGCDGRVKVECDSRVSRLRNPA